MNPQLQGIVGLIGNLCGPLISGYAAHEASTLKERPQLKKYAPLINDFAQRAAAEIMDQDVYGILREARESVFSVVEDIISHIFETWALKGVTDDTQEELAEHLLANLASLCKEEYSREEVPKKIFQNIARRLVEESFPGKENDPHLPKGVRDILKREGFYHFCTSLMNRNVGFTWDQVINGFAKQLQLFYERVLASDSPLKKELASVFLEADRLLLEAFIDTKTQNMSITGINLFSTQESNTLFQAILERLVRGEIASERDREVLVEARFYCIEKIKENIMALIATILQSARRRPQEIESQLMSKAETVFTAAYADQVAITRMDEQVLRSFLGDAKTLFPKDLYDFYEGKIKNILLLEECKEQGEELLLLISAHCTLMELLEPLIQEEEIQKLLPDFVTAKAVVHQLYSLAAPYVLEMQQQAKDAQAGKELVRTMLQLFL
ncbi:MAG: hypothetical protein JSR46_01235 [Verrucomicrobia bacterium]|nr:hypothetical protein [Verrucomicrobiota bacterium]